MDKSLTAKTGDVVPLSEAMAGVSCLGRMLGLLQLTYARAIVERLGEEEGIELISKVIKKYAMTCGQTMREEVLAKGMEAVPENYYEGESYRLPNFPGVHECREIVEVNGEKRRRAHGCVLAKLWKEQGGERLGRLYCYVDTAKYMAFNPNYKLIHTKAMPDGDEFCEFALRPSTEKERTDFFSEDKEWLYIDK